MVSIRNSKKLVKKVGSLRSKRRSFLGIGIELWISPSTVQQLAAAHKKGCKTIREYEDELAREKGFYDWNDYRKNKNALRKIQRLDRLPFMEERISQRRIEQLADSGRRTTDYIATFDQSRYDLIEEILEEMPQRYKEIVKKHFLEGKSFKEIGGDYGIKPQRVHQITVETLNLLRLIYNIRFPKT